MKFYGGAGDSAPSGALAQIGYDGQTQVFGAQLSYPLVRLREQSLNLLANFDAIQSNVLNNLGPNGAAQRSSYDSLRILRLGADYAVLDTLLGPERGGLNGFSGRVSPGLGMLGASHNGDTTTPPPRLGEDITFTKFNGQASRTQTLFRPYADATVAAAFNLAGQYSNDIIPPAEKFYLGGPTFNRGYYYGQVSGDKGLTVDAELRLNTPIPLPRPVPFELRSQFYAFYDWGEVWQNTSLEAGATGADVALTQANAIDALGAFSAAGHGFHLVDGSNLMLTGVVTANSVWIQDSGKIDLSTGNGFAGLGTRGGDPRNKEAFPAAGSAGVHLQAANFTMTQNPGIKAGGLVNWTFALTGTGNVGLGSFLQPSVKLFLSLAGGTADGTVNVAGLQVQYTTPTGKTVNLSGVVGGNPGMFAAATSQMSSKPNNNYQVNGCPISSVNCVQFTALTVPVINPVQDVQMGWMLPLPDADMMLPDVAERDYWRCHSYQPP
ncbi:ShlB/FhaC/HecB family hemolysin secretion/activation protein [Rhodopila globiformis]|uniref:ShlB/FhaC/HecB family hemolysin secretion/activation protein n=1 Tax=Rhodopila globiformis TaxID=1071 RepID=UPI0011AFE265|nr:ShlB/FhaC/HecB family hemolysin secretion/activation protein [Rhodopila globiformis]